MAQLDPPLQQLRALCVELELYQPGLGSRACLIAANKGDTPDASRALRGLRAGVGELYAAGGLPGLAPPERGGSLVTAVSALHGRNLGRLVRRMRAALRSTEGEAREEPPPPADRRRAANRDHHEASAEEERRGGARGRRAERAVVDGYADGALWESALWERAFAAADAAE
jgi:GTPase involved in cell partitioning and DNA repair